MMSEFSIRGYVHKYGDNINTDFISPAPFVGMPDEVMFAHAMEGVDPQFSKKVRPGDILVAGKNFGSGSSRETAPYVIQGNGISVVIAEFFARIFYRNAINIGLPVLTCLDVADIDDGDELEVDPQRGVIHNITKEKQYICTKFPPNIMTLIEDGGLLKHLEKELVAQKNLKSV